MGGPKTPSIPDPPPLPEIKKRTDVDARKAREDTRKAAISRFGLAGTDVTKGALSDSSANVKKKTLGG